MNTSTHQLTSTLYREECAHPALSEMLSYYVVGLLSDPASVEMEEHLLDCLHCRETYLGMLSLVGQPRRGRCPPVAGDVPLRIAGSNVVSIAEYRKGRP